MADLVPALVMDDASVTYRTFGSKRSVEGSRTPKWMSGHIGAVDYVPAVRNVSFVAHHGESIGLIGHNGSGKSTLMRAMAGLVPLAGGSVYTDGRASLLGVGGALMKDLTGERNITLGCLALGLSPKQVAERFDSVVEFADIGPSIRLPMRALSSGQAARLRFAISTAAQPEILLIDEALATGDAKFRKKSKERIDLIRDTAGTVVLVSHSMSTIRQTCSRGLWMHRGQLRMDGPVDEVVDAYEESLG
ncbi:ABC transporter ATP-binding protein [Nocardioides sp.]|uniref:ABC transporter ATP-binding protein n=1 Tax=Nocardioides sp. TaxID=35761 RepID=UPI003D0F0F14